MAAIPQYTSQVPAGTFRAGVREVATPDIRAMFGPAIEAAQHFEQAQAKLAAQQEVNDLATTIANHDAGIAELKNAVDQNPNYLGREQQFINGAMELNQKLQETMSQSPVVQRGYQLHLMKTLPIEAINIRANGLKAWNEDQKGEIANQADRVAREAAQEPDPVIRDAKIKDYYNTIDLARKNGTYGAGEAEKLKILFRDKALNENMDFLRRTDRAKLYTLDRQGAFSALDPITRLKTLEAARVDAEQEQTARDKMFEQTKREVKRWYSAEANAGALSSAAITEGLLNKNPWITPDEWRDLQRVNENPPLDSGNLPVRALMQEYRSGSPTLKRIYATRDALNKLSADLGHPNNLLSEALHGLQIDERSMRTLQSQETLTNIKVAEDDFMSKKETSPMGGIIGRMQHNQDQSDLGDIRNKVRSGVDPKAAVKDTMDKRKAAQENVPTRNKTIMNIAPRE